VTVLYSQPRKKCQSLDNDADLRSELRNGACIETEEIYWFALALTGDPEFAASLVADTEKLTPRGRGIFRN
jgi:hypothetical protein